VELILKTILSNIFCGMLSLIIWGSGIVMAWGQNPTIKKNSTQKKANVGSPTNKTPTKTNPTKPSTTKTTTFPNKSSTPKDSLAQQKLKQDSIPPKKSTQDSTVKKKTTTPEPKKKKKKKNTSGQKPKSNNTTKDPKATEQKPPLKEKPKHISPLGDDAPIPKDYVPQFNGIDQKNSDILVSLFNQQTGSFKQMIKNPSKHKIQIIYTQVRRFADNRPQLRHHTYNLDTLEHFFPASMVKLPTCAMVLEKLNGLDITGLDKYTHVQIKNGRYPCVKGNSKLEASRRYGYPTLAHYIKDALVASGNVAFDRLYEFMGQRELNDKLHEKGYTSFVITQRYGSYCGLDENRHTPAMVFFKGDSVVYRQAEQTCRTEYRYKAKNNNTGEVSGRGLQYTYRNFGTLKDLHEVLLAIMMPMTVPKKQRFKLTKEDYQLLHKYMSMLPTESKDPVYDRSWFIPTRMKYLYYGSNDHTPDPNIRIFNKVGLAHGFLIDCAYFVDFEAKIEFFLSAVICVKDNPNDANPEYFKDGMPFMKKLGEIIYEYEKTRKLKYPPDLSFYIHDYTKY